jgi:hypothetical protein
MEVFEVIKATAVGVVRGIKASWRLYRSLPILAQWLISVPLAFGAMFSLIFGSMGLAFWGTAVAINAWVIGPAVGVISVLLAKAGIIILRDQRAK